MNRDAAHNVRVSAKAIIVHDNRILLIAYKSESDAWYTLPGGGQNFGETLSQTLIRECLEETAYRIEPDRLVFVREYIGENHEFAESDFDVHQIELMFLAHLADQNGKIHDSNRTADSNQIGAQWVGLADLPNVPLFPAVLRRLISRDNLAGEAPIYLGDIN